MQEMAPLSTLHSLAQHTAHHWRAFRPQITLNLLLGLLQVGCGLAFVGMTKLAIDVATGRAFIISLNTALWALGALMLLQVLMALTGKWVRTTLTMSLQNRIQYQLFSQLQQSQWPALRNFHSGDILNRLQKDVAVLVTLISEDFPTFITTCLQFVGAFAFLFWLEPRLALLIVFIAPFFLLVSKVYFKRQRQLTQTIRRTESGIQSFIQESLQHILIIKTLQRAEYMCKKLSGQQTHLYKKTMDKTLYSSLSSTLMNIGFALGYLTTFAWGVVHLQQGLISYGALLAFIQLVGQIQGPVRTLSKYVPVFINASTAAERLHELEQLPSEPSPSPTLSPEELRAPFTLTLRNVGFSYAPDARPILDHLSFQFPAGSVTAIQGETGSGKTTLIRLMLALIPPTEGEVGLLFPSEKWCPVSASLRQTFTYVPQGNTLLSGSIRDNLLLGCPAADDAQMWEVLHCAAADFVKKLPNGLDTLCSELGGGLSEGQAQRICIARALLREAPIMIFDESTSALDAQTEALVTERIVHTYTGRTLIFITHRTAILPHCTQQLHLKRKIS